MTFLNTNIKDLMKEEIIYRSVRVMREKKLTEEVIKETMMSKFQINEKIIDQIMEKK